EVLAIDRTGKATFLEEPEEGPISTMVTSLCGRNTERHWKFGCLPVRKVGFLMMSSDGLINSLSSTREYIRFATILEDRLHRFPRDEVQAALPRWLADISRRGSGDDVSVVALTMKTTQTNKGEKA
ncbi:MAG: protein phosphatase 2C domain-containing protein, partial [Holophagae bacterium]|nr:protein phosphatase 2C domain-containing protein [Holophagae bacterium]